MDQNRTTSFRLRGCPRCGGDLFLDTLESAPGEAPDYVCIQCGRRTLPARPGAGQMLLTATRGNGEYAKRLAAA